MTTTEDWTKFVTLNPPNEVKFKFQNDDRTEMTQESQMEIDNQKAIARIEIINKSKSAILFKVKTTNIKNYMVRPNAEIIPSEHSISVKIVTQNPIGKTATALVSDRFLVQLTKFENPPQ